MTKIRLDVVGDPIEHSKSPIIHETVLAGLGLDYEYRKVRIEKGKLPGYLEEVRQLGICGFNLTMPHKQDIIPYLDYIDSEAEFYNSVNTVKVQDGKLLGYNTDGYGFLQVITDKGLSCNDKNIVIFGAGGVVSTIAKKMSLEGAKKITILNRTLSAAQKIAESLTDTEAVTSELTPENMTTAVCDCDILVNGTPLGMEGISSDFEDFSFFDSLKRGALVYDLIYNPPKTTLLKEAQRRGFDTANGLEMLIYQGLWADKLFLDTDIDFALYKGKIENKLKNFKNFKK